MGIGHWIWGVAIGFSYRLKKKLLVLLLLIRHLVILTNHLGWRCCCNYLFGQAMRPIFFREPLFGFCCCFACPSDEINHQKHHLFGAEWVLKGSPTVNYAILRLISVGLYCCHDQCFLFTDCFWLEMKMDIIGKPSLLTRRCGHRACFPNLCLKSNRDRIGYLACWMTIVGTSFGVESLDTFDFVCTSMGF